MRALARGAAGAIGHGNKAWMQRLESLDRFPQHLLHFLCLRWEEFEADGNVTTCLGEQRQMAGERFERVHAALRCGIAALTPRHNVTVNSPPLRCSMQS